MSVYKLAAVGAGGVENGIAQLDVQFDGVITAISGSTRSTFAANNDFVQVEASFLSVNTIGTNDTRGSLFSMFNQFSSLANGFTTTGKDHSVGNLAIALNAGERLWLHVVATAAIGSNNEIYIYVEDGQAVPTAQRRR